MLCDSQSVQNLRLDCEPLTARWCTLQAGTMLAPVPGCCAAGMDRDRGWVEQDGFWHFLLLLLIGTYRVHLNSPPNVLVSEGRLSTETAVSGHCWVQQHVTARSTPATKLVPFQPPPVTQDHSPWLGSLSCLYQCSWPVLYPYRTRRQCGCSCRCSCSITFGSERHCRKILGKAQELWEVLAK